MKEAFEDLEWRLPKSEGGLWISFSGTPYFSKQGKLLGYRGTAKKISQIAKKALIRIDKKPENKPNRQIKRNRSFWL